ncbi:MAG: hypothetical protein ACRDHD_05215 [Candidatus Limnocylindria bacterium]
MRPVVLAFDVNETLLDLRALDGPFERVLLAPIPDVVGADLTEVADALLSSEG